MELKFRILCFKTNTCKKSIFRYFQNKRIIKLFLSTKVRLFLNNLSPFSWMELHFNFILMCFKKKSRVVSFLMTLDR